MVVLFKFYAPKLPKYVSVSVCVINFTENFTFSNEFMLPSTILSFRLEGFSLAFLVEQV